MKFGQQLLSQQEPSYPPTSYLDYAGLKTIIKKLSSQQLDGAAIDMETRQVSLSVQPPTNRLGMPIELKGGYDVDVTDEAFFVAMDVELGKVEKFTIEKVSEARSASEARSVINP